MTESRRNRAVREVMEANGGEIPVGSLLAWEIANPEEPMVPDNVTHWPSCWQVHPHCAEAAGGTVLTPPCGDVIPDYGPCVRPADHDGAHWDDQIRVWRI